MSDFNPRDHLTKLQGKDYLEVRWRLAWLRADHPGAIISTELIAYDVAEEWAIVRAIVSLPDGGSATGMVFQRPTGIAKDWIANGETSAVGRALGALGYGTQFATEFDQGDQAVDSPVGRKSVQRERTLAEVTEARRQLNQRLLAVMDAKKAPQAVVASHIKAAYSAVRSGDLTDEQMAAVIAWLEGPPQLSVDDLPFEVEATPTPE